MSQKKNEGILSPTEIRVVGSYTDRLLTILTVSERGPKEFPKLLCLNVKNTFSSE